MHRPHRRPHPPTLLEFVVRFGVNVRGDVISSNTDDAADAVITQTPTIIIATIFILIRHVDVHEADQFQGRQQSTASQFSASDDERSQLAASTPSTSVCRRPHQLCVLARRLSGVPRLRVGRVLRHLGADDASPGDVPAVDHPHRAVRQLPRLRDHRGLRPGDRRTCQSRLLLGILSRWTNVCRQK